VAQEARKAISRHDNGVVVFVYVAGARRCDVNNVERRPGRAFANKNQSWLRKFAYLSPHAMAVTSRTVSADGAPFASTTKEAGWREARRPRKA
jgi:hypothetical protein